MGAGLSMGLRQKHDLVSKLCPKPELQAIQGANRKLVSKCHFPPWIVNNRSGYKWKKRPTLFSLSSPSAHSFLHHPRSIMPSHISSYLLSSWLISFTPPGPSWPIAVKYLDHSPHFPDGFSKTSTVPRPGCSWGGTLWWIRSQSSGRIVPESRPQSGRSVCPSPPGHNHFRTSVFSQIAT